MRRKAHNWRKRNSEVALVAAITAVAGSKDPAVVVCSDFIVITSLTRTSAGYTAVYGAVNVFSVVNVAELAPASSAESGLDTTPFTAMRSPSDQRTGYFPSVFSPSSVLVEELSETAWKTVPDSSSDMDSVHAYIDSNAAEIIMYVVILLFISY